MFILILLACSVNDSTLNRVLTNQGFTDISNDGYAWFGCSEDDSFHSNFSATNSQGKRVSGTVCCGTFKDCTVRW